MRKRKTIISKESGKLILDSNTFLQYTSAIESRPKYNYYQEERHYERIHNGNRSYGFKGLY
jgi:hypothetical protein